MKNQPKRSRRAVIVIRLLIAVTGMVAVGFGTVTAVTGRESVEDNGELFSVAVLDFDVTSTASGELEAKVQTELRSEVEGRSTIVEVVKEGTFVEKGDVLVRLSDDEIEKNLDNERLNYESAKSALISAESGLEIQISDNQSAIRAADLAIELAVLDLQKWREGDVQEKRNELKLAIERGEREEERTKKKFERSKELKAEGFLSEDQYDQDEISFIEAQSNYTTAQLRERVYETYTRIKEEKEKISAVDEARAELVRIKSKNESQLVNKQAELLRARQQAAIRKTQVERLETQLEKTIITAPTAGLVVFATSGGGGWRGDNRGPLDVGREVRHNEGLISLPNTSEMIANIKIHESLVGRISEGLRANVKIDAVPDHVFTGTVWAIGIVASDGGWRDPNNREYDVKIMLDADGNEFNLKPSMRCEAEIIINEVRGALVVPVPAIYSDASTQFVYIAEGERFRRQPVSVGSRSDTYVEITDGLALGDRVLLFEPSPAMILADDGFASADETKTQSPQSRGRSGDGERPRRTE